MSYTKRFWLSLIMSIPMMIQMIGMLFNWMMPGHNWIAFIATTIIMIFGAFPFWKSGWAAFKNHNANMDTLIAIGTAVAYFYSVFAMFTHRAVFFESAAFITVFVLLGQVLEEKMRNNASSAVEKLLDLQVKDAEVLRNNEFVKVPLEEIKIGDMVRVKPGEKVAVDGEISEGSSTIDESMVTGESMPVTKSMGDKVIGSTINKNGTFVFKVEKIGSETMLSQIVELVKKAQTSHAPIQKLTDKISNIFVPAVLIIAIVTFIVWYVLVGDTFVNALLYATSVIVIACPCALGLATPTAIMVGTARSAKMGVLIKNGEVLEVINDVKTVVFDKTGTITEGIPKVTNVDGDEKEVLTVAASLEAVSEHPLALAITKKAKELAIKTQSVEGFTAIEGKGVRATVAGQEIIVGNNKLIENYQITDEMKKQMNTWQAEAKTVVLVGKAQKIIGLIAIQDAPKKNAFKAMNALKKRDLQPVMLTGDNQLVADAIGQEVGISQVIADVLPQDKADQISSLQAQNKVAFVGDGINDAPALSTADVGIAMGSGTDIAIESGGIVLVQNDLMGVVRAIDMSKKTFNRIKLNLFWALIYNVIGIPVAAGLFSVWGITLSPELAGLAMAFSSISVVGSSLLLNKTKIADD
ncbi:copper-translocating P-type ATPase [Lactobacillus sp. YT155]|uniref:copper-translocating P-type ATPase n=1 Tax=Lactobacillus sp. YT155 TaxID=3060955 RepID=UPI00265D7472|nr:copper-translocating P-type ATPase [Lactobacillus sp. YT155]MDO1604499.1 copper-translocating P-type ATPase [Lactobacillus sp. YT155]